jgi:mannose-6-phosphate isomerase-like protein (cupin superfamily)
MDEGERGAVPPRVLDVVGDRMIIRAVSPDGLWSLVEVQSPVGGGPPMHMHPWDEVFHVIEGALDLTVVSRTVRAGPGDTVAVPAGTPHTFRGAGPAGGRFLSYTNSGRAPAFFSALDGVTELQAILDIAKRFDVAALPPPGG